MLSSDKLYSLHPALSISIGLPPVFTVKQPENVLAADPIASHVHILE